MSAISRNAVLIWPQSLALTDLTWRSSNWVGTTCRTQKWSCFLLDWRVQTVNWRRYGKTGLHSKWDNLYLHLSNNHAKILNNFCTESFSIFGRSSSNVCNKRQTCLPAGCRSADSRRKAALIWPQRWAPTPLTWGSWTSATTTCRTLEWSWSLFIRITPCANWKNYGKTVTEWVSVLVGLFI